MVASPRLLYSSSYILLICYHLKYSYSAFNFMHSVTVSICFLSLAFVYLACFSQSPKVTWGHDRSFQLFSVTAIHQCGLMAK